MGRVSGDTRVDWLTRWKAHWEDGLIGAANSKLRAVLDQFYAPQIMQVHDAFDFAGKIDDH